MAADFKVVNDEAGMKFEIEGEGEIAYLEYRFYKKDMAMMHTFVPKKLEGKGIASALAKEAFSYAEKLNKAVMVYCPFVAAFVKRHPEYRKQLDAEFHRSI